MLKSLYCWNDTLDNISLLVDEDSPETNCTLSKYSSNKSKLKSSQCAKNVSKYISKECDYDTSISIDDSEFFKESFCDSNKHDLVTNSECEINKSEEMFTSNDVSPLINNSLLQVVKNVDKVPENSSKKYMSPNYDKSLDLELETQKRNSLNHSLLCELHSWGLPFSILQKYEKRKIKNLLPWQIACLSKNGVLEDNCNLVYSAPTSAGKTLVAEILAIKTVLEQQKKIIFVLPYVSVVREKMFYFQDILGSSGIRVEGFMGSYAPPGGFQAVQFAVCTIEKANSIVNQLLESGTLSDIGLVVIDEMHLVGDPNRGYLIELLLTKLRYMSLRDPNVKVQIIGMSATLPNLGLLAKWLNAELYTTDFRPIPLNEFYLINNDIYDCDSSFKRRLHSLPELDVDSDNILQLCLETIQESCSVLIFCPNKNWCENLAQQIAIAFYKLGCLQSPLAITLRKQLNTNAIAEVLEQLKRCPVGLDNILNKTVSFGAAFHHAGLTMDERDIIEGAFRNGVVKVLVATSTLSSGVNLPAKRVIIRTPFFHGKPIDTMTYRQMIGRAGRMGRDTSGESIVICPKNNSEIVQMLLSSELSPVNSCLEGSGKLKRALLEIIASSVASTPEDIANFSNCTLLAANDSEGYLSSPIEDAVNYLIQNEFIKLQNLNSTESKYIATALGKACLSSSMSPEDGLDLFKELETARQCFVLETELHLVYLVTPYSICSQWGNLDWMLFLDIWEKLSASMKRVGELVGVRESYIVSGSRGVVQINTPKLYQKLQIHKRFFTALSLQDLVNEVPLAEVAKKFNCTRGLLQSLQQTASTFAGMVTSFSRELGWSSVEILVSQFQNRLQFGVSRDLLDLMRIPTLSGPRARALYNGGIQNLAQLASADVNAVAKLLLQGIPFESSKERSGETEWDAQKRKNIRGIWITGKQGLTENEAANILIEDAQKFLQYEMGIVEVKWKAADLSFNVDSFNKAKSITSFKNVVKSTGLNKSKALSINGSGDFLTPLCLKSHSTPHFLNISANSQLENNSFEVLKKTINQELHITPTSPCRNSFENEDSQVKIYKQSALDKSESKLYDLSASDHSLFDVSGDSASNIRRDATEPFKDFLKIDDSKTVSILDEGCNSNQGNTDSGLEFENASILENAFVSSFELSSSFENSSNKNTSNDFVAPSQTEINSVTVATKDISASNYVNKAALYTGSTRKRTKASCCKDVSDQPILCEQILKKRKLSYSDCEQIKNQTVNNGSSHFSEVNVDSLLNLNSSGHICSNSGYIQPTDFSKIDIVEVCDKKFLYETFCKELFEQNEISLSVACSKVAEQKVIIGRNALREFPYKNKKFVYKEREVKGVALSWGYNIAYYISLEAKGVENADKINLLKMILDGKVFKVRMFDSKEQIKVLKQCCDIDCNSYVDDSKVADWILDPEGKEKTLQGMALKYSPETVSLSRLSGNCRGVGSIGIDLHSSVDQKIRSSLEAVISWYLVDSVKHALQEQNRNILQSYEYEMKTMLILAKMELQGIGASKEKLEELCNTVKEQLTYLECQAYKLAGRRFSFTISKDVAKVLGLYRGRKISTAKKVLEHIENPIANIILLWRKLSGTLTKMIYPMLQLIDNNRIHGFFITHTSTGRISMHEPNLQNVAKNFEIVNYHTNTKIRISCRMAFMAAQNYVLLSADYCQLELRLLTHLSQDLLLKSIMKTDKDVFKLIASKWKNIEESEVDDIKRQWAKQLCYGIIYGMGCQKLAKELLISEKDAIEFIESFYSTYPGIKLYIEETIKNCRDVGYVETIKGRRRYLPNINHQSIVVKAQAERQAVNTTIQGSAADLAKIAMVKVENKIKEKFPYSSNQPRLVLHLHDELLYEVPRKYLSTTAKLIKKTMEEAVILSIPLPVKLKSGHSWGGMEEYFI